MGCAVGGDWQGVRLVVEGPPDGALAGVDRDMSGMPDAVLFIRRGELLKCFLFFGPTIIGLHLIQRSIEKRKISNSVYVIVAPVGGLPVRRWAESASAVGHPAFEGDRSTGRPCLRALPGRGGGDSGGRRPDNRSPSASSCPVQHLRRSPHGYVLRAGGSPPSNGVEISDPGCVTMSSHTLRSRLLGQSLWVSWSESTRSSGLRNSLLNCFSLVEPSPVAISRRALINNCRVVSRC